MVNKYSLTMIKDMSKRIQKFIKENKRLPNYVNAKTMNGKQVQLQKPTYAGLFENCNRFALKNNRYPNYVSETCTANNPLIMDYQDVNYTCGPTSLSMASQLLYGYVSEQEFQKACKTTTKGTGPANLINGAKLKGYKLTQIPRTTADVKKALDSMKFVIAHIDTIKASCLGYKSSKNFGHWILIYGVDGAKYKVADPTKGLKIVNATCINNAMYQRKINFYSVEIL